MLVSQWVAADIAAFGVPLEQLDVGYEDAVSVSADQRGVCVRHVYQGAAFDAVCIAHVEADIVLDIESP